MKRIKELPNVNAIVVGVEFNKLGTQIITRARIFVQLDERIHVGLESETAEFQVTDVIDKNVSF